MSSPPPPAASPGEPVRLQRFLASAGLGSRRNCEELITSGRVMVDGEEASELGVRVEPDKQEIRVDGEVIRQQRLRYFLVNKPTGYVCTNRDPSGRPLAISLVPLKDGPRLFTVGRLDESSEGLLLVTNDGDLAHKLLHPRFRVIRTYRIQVAGIPTPETIRSLKKGLRFSDGQFRVRSARRIKTQGKSSFLDIEMTEGRNREVRRLFARVGHKVLTLKRTAFGPLRLSTLASGRARELKGEELRKLREFANGQRPTTGSRNRPGRARNRTSSGGKTASKSAGQKRSAGSNTRRKPGRPKGK